MIVNQRGKDICPPLVIDGMKKRHKYSHGISRREDTAFRAGCVRDGNTHPVGATPKGSNGVVAVGLPHRNSSAFIQAHINQWEEKERIRMDPRFAARVTKVMAG